MVDDGALGSFSEATRAWFGGAFTAPTPAQAGAWEAAQAGDHALVVAPTGSGKTLSAFLWSVDRLLTGPEPATKRRARVLYVSPLKALAADVERNLRSPLVGITRAAADSGTRLRDVTVGVRTGDTPAGERRSLATRPPDILITTPESLYLVLTSAAREGLRGVETVIVDEVHAVAGTKRGAHLAVTLERLDALLDRPAQRIGLSATVRPVDAVARFLAGTRTPDDGGRPVRVVQPQVAKELQVDVVVPVPDLTDLPDAHAEGTAREPDLSGDAAGRLPGPHRASIWPHVEERLVDLITTHRSTIVFANSRRGAERLAARVNEAWAERRRTDDGGPPPSATGWAAQVPGQSGTAAPATGEEIAHPHHGSMSREERARIETALKSGVLPAVVATSTLELGIDMGTVDLVVQVGSPPSVASALQRIGRAGHQVGAVSRGVVLPTHRGDLLAAAITSVRAQQGAIEELAVVRNPLDVLAQQVVAMLAVEDWSVAELAALVRRSAPFESLGDASLHGVLDMLSGRYPSEEFAELRPRLVWDRSAGTLTARPGALRLATTSGGTIPDRGLYGVFLAATAGAGEAGTGVTSAGRGGRRVGELDEEMVFESRVGDTFTLGSSTWRIEDITPDRVLVSPAQGLPGRLPFWKGDSPGRPAELGRALGAFVRATAALPAEQAHAQLAEQGLDRWARDNLLGYLDEQRGHAHLSDDRTIVLERFRDELGDWRLVIHSPFGARVHTPWALVLAARLREQLGIDVAAMPADDGIVLRLPDVGPEGGQLPVSAADLLLDPAEVTEQVVEALAGSAHFAARFREAAARALLLPRRRPDRRQPLWQQRHRAAQLLGVAADHPDFPIVLEAVRECLQDDFDTPALADLMGLVARREVRVLEVATPTPSPFARSLLMGYVGQFLYDGDAPIAERRAAALTLDPGLLAELIGPGTELADLLDPLVLEQVEAEVSLRRHPARDVEALADLVRRLGPVTTAQLAERCDPPSAAEAWLTELAAARRVISVRVGGGERWAVVEDAGRLRDALGVALPVGLPEGVLAPVVDPLGDLVRRYARTHGPFTAEEPGAHLGLGPAALAPVLRRLTEVSALVTGRLRPQTETAAEFCDADVLRRVRRRTLAALRADVEAVPAATLGAFLPRWQQVGSAGTGTAALSSVVDQLAGARVPASALEALILPARVSDYRPALLDELTTAGDVVWCGAGALPGVDGYLVLTPADSPELLPPPRELPGGDLPRVVMEVLAVGGRFFRDLVTACREQVPDAGTEGVLEALWELVWSGHVTNDSLAPVRARLSGGRPAHHSANRAPRARGALTRRRSLMAAAGSRPSGPLPPAAAGRWSPVSRDAEAATTAALGQVAALLERHGVLTRGAAGLEDLPGGFGAAYPLLSRLEDAGKIRRGYLVEGLGAAQFALPECVDLLREAPRHTDRPGLLLAATDPASPYGAALPWPEPATEGARPRRAAGAVVVLTGGELGLYVERGGRTLLSFTTDPERLTTAARELAGAVAAGRLGRVTLHRIDGEPALGARGPVRAALEDVGFFATPRGLRLRENRAGG